MTINKTAHPVPRTYERPQLTERRKAIVKFLHRYATWHGWAASIEEVCDEVKASANQVLYDLKALDEVGYIVFQGSRQIKVLWLP